MFDKWGEFCIMGIEMHFDIVEAGHLDREGGLKFQNFHWQLGDCERFLSSSRIVIIFWLGGKKEF